MGYGTASFFTFAIAAEKWLQSYSHGNIKIARIWFLDLLL